MVSLCSNQSSSHTCFQVRKRPSTHPPSFPSGLIAGHRALLERVVITCHAISDERGHVPFSHVYETEVVPAPSTSPPQSG